MGIRPARRSSRLSRRAIATPTPAGVAHKISEEGELEEFVASLADVGYYPYVLDRAEYEELRESDSGERQDEIFVAEMNTRIESISSWARSSISTASSRWPVRAGPNPPLGHRPREESREELHDRLERVISKLDDHDRAIFNFHEPPYNSRLDEASELGDYFRPKFGAHSTEPVGGRAVREVIESYQPPLSLHGHIHESRGRARIGETIAINPGSVYSEGPSRARSSTSRRRSRSEDSFRG